MEQGKFLELCSEVSRLPEGFNYMRQNVPEKLTVIHDGIRYYPYRLICCYINGERKLRAVLHDLEANSTNEVPLEEVTKGELR